MKNNILSLLTLVGLLTFSLPAWADGDGASCESVLANSPTNDLTTDPSAEPKLCKLGKSAPLPNTDKEINRAFYGTYREAAQQINIKKLRKVLTRVASGDFSQLGEAKLFLKTARKGSVAIRSIFQLLALSDTGKQTDLGAVPGDLEEFSKKFGDFNDSLGAKVQKYINADLADLVDPSAMSAQFAKQDWVEAQAADATSEVKAATTTESKSVPADSSKPKAPKLSKREQIIADATELLTIINRPAILEKEPRAILLSPEMFRARSKALVEYMRSRLDEDQKQGGLVPDIYHELRKNVRSFAVLYGYLDENLAKGMDPKDVHRLAKYLTLLNNQFGEDKDVVKSPTTKKTTNDYDHTRFPLRPGIKQAIVRFLDLLSSSN